MVADTRIRPDVGDQRDESLAGSDLGQMVMGHLLSLLGRPPLRPAAQPGVVVATLVKIDVQGPAHVNEPIGLHPVELLDRDPADLGPGAVLEGVVVEELTAQQQGHCKKTPDFALIRLELAARMLHGVDPLSKVVHTKEDCRAWQTCRREDLGDKFAEGDCDRRLWQDDSHCHLGHILRHNFNLIIEDGTHTTRHHGGWRRDSVKDLTGTFVGAAAICFKRLEQCDCAASWLLALVADCVSRAEERLTVVGVSAVGGNLLIASSHMLIFVYGYREDEKETVYRCLDIEPDAEIGQQA